MGHVSTIQTNTQTYTLEQLQAAINSGAIKSADVQNVSVFNQSADPSACTDGKDDGKIGFFEGLWSGVKGAVKGVVNGIKGCFTDENGKFSLGKTLKTALTVGACFIPGVGPIIGAGLCAYGAVKGATGIAKGISAASAATTDAEAKAAFESIGANTVATAASVVGLKGSVGAIAKQAGVTGIKGLASGSGTGVTGTIKNIASNVTKGTRNYYGTQWANATASTTTGKLLQVGKQTMLDTGANIYEAATAVKEFAKDKTSKFTKNKATKSTPESSVVKDPVMKTKTTTKNITDLPEDVQLSIKSGNSSGHIDGANTYKTLGDGKVEITTTYDPSATTVSGSLNKAKGYINNAKGYIKNYADTRAAYGDPNLVTQGLGVKNAAWTMASVQTTEAANNMTNAIPSQTVQMATVNTQTGYEYDLLDYNIMTEDQLNQSYSNIMQDAYMH